MSLQTIDVPPRSDLPVLPDASEQLIDACNERIENFFLSDEAVIENFVPCDFHLVGQALGWILANHLAAGNRFCEWGAGFGVASLLAAAYGMESVGIEIEETLVERAIDLNDQLGLEVHFHHGSFVPREFAESVELIDDYRNVDTTGDDSYAEIGLGLDEFDLFFAFPWPGENGFFESVFEFGAGTGSLLLTYRGREGMHLLRKTS